MALNFSQAVVVQFWLLKEEKSSKFDLKDTGESPRDPLSQQDAAPSSDLHILTASVEKGKTGPNSLPSTTVANQL